MPKTGKAIICLGLMTASGAMAAQMTEISPQVRTRTSSDAGVGVLEVAAHFVTTIRLPEAVNSVVVGDPARFQVEHSEQEPNLVFVKALTGNAAQTNLLISTVKGREISMLVISRGPLATGPAKVASVDFLVRYWPSGGFLVEPQIVPSVLVGQSQDLSSQPHGKNNPDEKPSHPAPVSFPANHENSPANSVPESSATHQKPSSLDDLLVRQEKAPLPVLYGEHIQGESVKGDRLRTGISEVVDGGQQVIVLFSVVNTSKHAILVMPPQVQLGGKQRTGKVLKHDRWTTAEQLPIMDFRLSRRRLAPGERADGVVAFERPPYKQANEMLFLQMAESGAVDRPALAPIGFGVSSYREEKGL